MAFCPLSFVNFFVFKFLFHYKCACEEIPKSACLSMFVNTRLLKFVCLSYLNNLPLFLPLQLAGLSKLPPPSLKVLLLVDELEVDQLLPLLVPVQLFHLLLVDKHHKEDVVQLDEGHLPPCFTSSSSSPPWCPRATSPTLQPPPPPPRLSAPASLPCHFQSWCCTVDCFSPTELWWPNVLILYLILTLPELVECRQKLTFPFDMSLESLLFLSLSLITYVKLESGTR